jgi:hypothetical protein
MTAGVLPPCAARAALQTRLSASARHIVHPNHPNPLPEASALAKREEVSSKLPAGDSCIRLVPAVVADRAPLALVQHFDATTSCAVLVRKA